MSIKKLFAAPLLLAGTIMVLGAAGAEAQTATNLICNGCVGKKDIQKKAVRNKHLKDGTIKPSKLHRSAKPGAASNIYSGGTSSFNSTTGVTVITDTVEVPSNGNLVAVATWRWNLGNGEGSDCTITLDSTTFDTTFRNRGYNANAATLYPPGSTTAMFEDVPAGEHLVRLFCRADAGDTVFVQFPNLTTMFFPGTM